MLAYIDTNILLALSGFDKVDKDIKRSLQKIFYNTDVKIPQIVLGEALTIILSESNSGETITNIENLHNKIEEIKCTIEPFPTTNDKIIQCALELQRKSDVVTNMDSLILAHPIMDNNATHFYTKDERLKNFRVFSYIKNLVNDGQRTQELNIPAQFTEE